MTTFAHSFIIIDLAVNKLRFIPKNLQVQIRYQAQIRQEMVRYIYTVLNGKDAMACNLSRFFMLYLIDKFSPFFQFGGSIFLPIKT
jgi:hypothetical protein